jgi:fermentation-respiration switch protein FrsA (DUF1100 family)
MVALKWILVFAVLGYGALLAAMYLLQRAIMYPTPQTFRTAPGAANFPQAQEVVLDTSDGEKVIVWHVPPREGKPVVIFFHGNGEILAWRVPRYRELVEDGTGLVALSFRGYAGSSGKPSEAGLLADGEAAYKFAVAHYPAERIVPWGYSLGSGVAVAIAAGHPVGKLILEAPYTSTVELGASAFPFLPVRWLMHDHFRSDRLIGAVHMPLLVMHGVHDTVVPVAMGERLFALANEPKRLVRFPGGDHINLDEQGAVKVARGFLAEGP